MITREIIINVGLFIETIGNIVLVTAAIFGILSSFIVIYEAAQSNKSSNNIVIINPSYSPHGNCQNYYEDLLFLSATYSIIGLVLAIEFQVYWVAITVVTLWLAAALLSWLGRTIVNFAANIPNGTSIKPSAPPYELLNESSNAFPVDMNSEDLSTYPVAQAEYHPPIIATVIGFC